MRIKYLKRSYPWNIAGKSSRPQLIISIFLVGAFLLLLGGGFYIQRAIFATNMDNRPLQVAVVESLDVLQPAGLENHAQMLMASAVYEGLVTYDEKTYSLKPLLAKNWEYTDDGKTINIELERGIKFSNGKEFTAADVKSSWEKSLARSQDWSNISMFQPIVGAKERINGSKSGIDGIQVVDSYNIKILLNKPNAAFIYSLTSPVFWIVDSPKDAAVCGTGPFVIQEAKPENVLLLRNEECHRGKSQLSAINFTRYPDENQALIAYKEGKADYLDVVPLHDFPAIAGDPQYKGLFIEKPVLEVYWLGFNLNREPYANNYLLRRALNYAVDRQAIIAKIGSGFIPMKGLIPSGSAAFNPQMRGYTYDAEKAQQLLAEAGYPQGKGLRPLTLTYNRDPGHKEIAEEIARQLATQGIVLQLQENDWDYYTRQLTNKQVSFFRLGWKADYADADNFLNTLFHSDSSEGSNLTGYNNPQVDKILDASRAEYSDGEARLMLLKRAEEIIVDDAPCLWLFQKNAIKLIGKDVRSLKLDNMEMIDWFEVN